jgi:choline kinase
MTDTAVILCAGGGTRLRPLTDDRPKALVDVGGETILGRAVRTLLSAGVRHLVIATGYRADAVRAALAGCEARVSFCHNADFERTQNSVSLHLCAESVGGRSFFKLDGDLLFHPDVIARLDADDGALSVAVDKSVTLGDEEMKVMTEGSAIRRFGKKLEPARCSGESIGIERLDEASGERLFRALAAAARVGRTDLYYEDVYSELIGEGLDARAVDVSGLPWFEVDTADDLARAGRLVESGKLDLRSR